MAVWVNAMLCRFINGTILAQYCNVAVSQLDMFVTHHTWLAQHLCALHAVRPMHMPDSV